MRTNITLKYVNLTLEVTFSPFFTFLEKNYLTDELKELENFPLFVLKPQSGRIRIKLVRLRANSYQVNSYFRHGAGNKKLFMKWRRQGGDGAGGRGSADSTNIKITFI